MVWETRYLIPGMVLKKDLLPTDTPEGNAPLLPEGKEITLFDIDRLMRHKIESIEIQEYDETFFELFRAFVISSIKSFSVENVSHVAEIYEYIAKKTPNFKFDMTRYLNEDLDLQEHKVNVTNMAVALATKYNNTVTDSEQISIKEMAEVAMLSDVGCRAKSPKILELIKKKYGFMLDKFQKCYPNINDDAFDYYHPQLHQFYSYLILKGSKLNNAQLTSILLHHEKEIGKYGPLGVEMGKQNPKLQSVQMAKILKVCELYDLLLYRAKEENPEQPFGNINKELDKMVASGITDPYWTKLLSLIVPVYPLGEKVELSDGTIGVVSGINEYDMSKPYVCDLSGKKIDLYKEKLVIIGLCNDNKFFRSSMSMSASA